MKTKIILTLALVLFILQGCVVKSIHPFYTSDDIIFKKELLGRWSDTDSSTWIIKQHQKSTGLFKPDQPDAAYDISFITEKGNAQFIGHLFELNNQLYLDFYPSEISCGNDMANFHMIGAHSIAKVNFSGGKLTINWYNEEWLAGLFKQNKIRIAHESTPYDTYSDESDEKQYILTASTSELQKFIIKYGNDPAAFKGSDGKKNSDDYSFILTRKSN